MLNKHSFTPHQIKQKLHSVSPNTHKVYYVLNIFKELLMDLLEAPVLQGQQSHFKRLATKIYQRFKRLHFCTSPTIIGLQQKEMTDYAYDEAPLY